MNEAPLRTFVSFRADVVTVSEPPGRELAEFVSAILADAHIAHDGPAEREGWAWTIRLQHEFTHVEIVIGEMQGRPDHWLITMDGHFSLARGLAVGGNAEEEREETLRPICVALDGALKQDPRFHEIRWYVAEEFDSNHGETWTESP